MPILKKTKNKTKKKQSVDLSCVVQTTLCPSTHRPVRFLSSFNLMSLVCRIDSQMLTLIGFRLKVLVGCHCTQLAPLLIAPTFSLTLNYTCPKISVYSISSLVIGCL